jgi:uncharacterized membrane protein YfcA
MHVWSPLKPVQRVGLCLIFSVVRLSQDPAGLAAAAGATTAATGAAAGAGAAATVTVTAALWVPVGGACAAGTGATLAAKLRERRVAMIAVFMMYVLYVYV